MTVEEWIETYVLPHAESRFFVEIGAAHATHLGALAGWHSVRLDRTGWEGVEQQLVTAENVNDILGARVPSEFDLLLIDIDGNDFWVWQAIRQRPVAVIVEYNALAPPGWTMPYDPAHYYDGSDWFGASLLSMTQLAHARGLTLVACDNGGANALFLRLDLAVQHQWRPLYPLVPSHSAKWKETDVCSNEFC